MGSHGQPPKRRRRCRWLSRLDCGLVGSVRGGLPAEGDTDVDVRMATRRPVQHARRGPRTGRGLGPQRPTSPRCSQHCRARRVPGCSGHDRGGVRAHGHRPHGCHPHRSPDADRSHRSPRAGRAHAGVDHSHVVAHCDLPIGDRADLTQGEASHPPTEASTPGHWSRACWVASVPALSRDDGRCDRRVLVPLSRTCGSASDTLVGANDDARRSRCGRDRYGGHGLVSFSLTHDLHVVDRGRPETGSKVTPRQDARQTSAGTSGPIDHHARTFCPSPRCDRPRRWQHRTRRS